MNFERRIGRSLFGHQTAVIPGSPSRVQLCLGSESESETEAIPARSACCNLSILYTYRDFFTNTELLADGVVQVSDQSRGLAFLNRAGSISRV
jgi:hypothetical protein